MFVETAALSGALCYLQICRCLKNLLEVISTPVGCLVSGRAFFSELTMDNLLTPKLCAPCDAQRFEGYRILKKGLWKKKWFSIHLEENHRAYMDRRTTHNRGPGLDGCELLQDQPNCSLHTSVPEQHSYSPRRSFPCCTPSPSHAHSL